MKGTLKQSSQKQTMERYLKTKFSKSKQVNRSKDT